MRAGWEALHAGLAHSACTLKFARIFGEMKGRHPVLGRFADVCALLSYLTTRQGDLDEKDSIYALLLERVQARGNDAEVAMSLLWLGLWPALDAIFRRRLRWVSDSPDELVSELAYCFVTVTGSVNLARLHRVAATLTRSTERDLVQSRQRVWEEQKRSADLPHELAEPVVHPEISALHTRPSFEPEKEVVALYDWLAHVVGRDADLVLGVVVLGESQLQAAQRLSIDHGVARKRLERALCRLRRHLQADARGVSEPGRFERQPSVAA